IGTDVPAATACTSVPPISALSSAVAFSVSISATGAPAATAARSATSQRVSVTLSSLALSRGARNTQASSGKILLHRDEGAAIATLRRTPKAHRTLGYRGAAGQSRACLRGWCGCDGFRGGT